MKFYFSTLITLFLFNCAFSNPYANNLYSFINIDTSFYIVVDKSDYELKVYNSEGWYATYPVVFGSKDKSDKLMQGDKKTPDGEFTIIQKKLILNGEKNCCLIIQMKSVGKNL